jgi:small-conductance mechanosensitive channel
MFKHKFKVGDRVQIREWDDMSAEFGTDGTNIEVLFTFTPGMRTLCGHSATIYRIQNNEIYLKNWDDNALHTYHISEGMIKAFEETIKVKFNQKEFSKLVF